MEGWQGVQDDTEFTGGFLLDAIRSEYMMFTIITCLLIAAVVFVAAVISAIGMVGCMLGFFRR